MSASRSVATVAGAPVPVDEVDAREAAAAQRPAARPRCRRPAPAKAGSCAAG